MSVTRDEKIVVAARFVYVGQAEAAKLHLQAAGIQAIITGAELVIADWLLGNAAGHVRVEVFESDLEQAKAILSRMPPASTLGDSQRDSVTAEKCLECGAELPETATTCPKCGWTYALPNGGHSAEHGDLSADTGEPVLQKFRWTGKWWVRFYLTAGVIWFFYWILFFLRHR